MSQVHLVKVSNNKTYRTFVSNNDQRPAEPTIEKGSNETLNFTGRLSKPFLAGRGFEDLERLSKDSGTIIKWHESGNSSIQIDINGEERGLFLAKSAINHMVRFSGMPLTHFLSIPLNRGNALSKSFGDFRKLALDLMEGGRDENFNLFIPTPKLHLTISVHNFANQEQVNAAIKTIDRILREKYDEPMVVSLEGLDIIKGRPEKCRVLYAKVVGTHLLDNLSRSILSDLVSKGYCSTLSVKWHCTLMNSKYGTGRSFNAKPLLESLGNYNFGRVLVSELHLSQFGGNIDNHGYYQSYQIFKLSSQV